MILEGAGYAVETALSGEDAWELFQKTQFDVVVTDFRMGGMNGLQLIALIRGSAPLVRTILLSGFAACLGITAEASGADEVLCKSNTEVPELLRAIRQLVNRPARKQPGSIRKLRDAKSAG